MKVYWRTFVYNADVDNDRLKRAYLEFGYIDDAKRFASNVFLQTKNGPLDFQGREPFHPMFGRMENTNQALELQVTQEYTGQHTMLTYLAPMWEEALKSDSYATNVRRSEPRRQRRRRHGAGSQ
jgi:alpha-glucuronidase